MTIDMDKRPCGPNKSSAWDAGHSTVNQFKAKPATSICYGLTLACMGLISGNSSAQTSGNNGYAQNGGVARAEQSERNQRVITTQDLPPTNTSMFVDADVLMNVKADEFVAVFGISQEGGSVQECNEKMDAVIKGFTDALKALHVRESDIFVDFITQPKIYEYDLAGDVAREKLAGFELKKNISIHYADRGLLDKLVAAAAKDQIYDLVKVDYVVKDINAVQSMMMDEASAVIKQKVARYEKLLGIKVEPLAQVYAERPAIHYPTQMYDSYTAAESESIARPPQRYTIQQARKGKTFFFNGLDDSGFDKVINPVILEPVVQFTLYLKVKYEVAR
jgi:uncharacterized protein YggE